jgi:hypothetical protein
MMLQPSGKQSILFRLARASQAMLLVSLLWALTAHATVIVRLGFEELVAQSALIFRGEAIEAVVTTQGDLVYTTVTFTITDILKGDAADDTVSLRFLGGSFDELVVSVEGQFIPAVGDRGVYFVATTQQQQVNPLSGWQQGYFPLSRNARGEDFIDMRQRPDFVIPGLEEDPLVEKMQTLGFTAEEIEAKFPQALRFSWNDFRDAILAEAGNAQGGVTP